MKLYLASSWRNEAYHEHLQALRWHGYEVYDFRDPAGAFQWSDIDPDWENWTAEEFRAGLTHPEAERGFSRDMKALEWCDALVLLLPCGRSAHLEAGWAKGAGKPVVIVTPAIEPELMYKMADLVTTDVVEAVAYLRGVA